MKPILKIDLSMAILFALSLFTGIQIHYANDFQTHEIWHLWSMIHTFVNVVFLIVATTHIKQHWRWYSSLFDKNKFATKSKLTILTTIVFLATSVTGILLLILIDGQGSTMGFVHYIIGLLFGVTGGLHFLKRWKIFRNLFAR